MRSLFAHEPFGSVEIGRPRMGCGHPAGPNDLASGAAMTGSAVACATCRRRLGQVRAPESAFALEDYLRRIDALTDKEERDRLKAKYEECSGTEDTSRQIACFAALAVDVAAALRKEPQAPGTATPSTTPGARPPAANGFPVVPVAIAGLVAAGLVVWLATRA